MEQTISGKTWILAYVPLALVLAGAFAVRVYNLNYNVPFNDEAVYVVVGKLGIFQWDWWSYNARSWMAGLPYAYPALTAIAYVTGGIIGSRLLSVIFSMLLLEELYHLTVRLLTADGEEAYAHTAGVIAVAIAGFAGTGLFISRLATYDMPSFFFLVLGMNYVLDSLDARDGKKYFLAALALLGAFVTKIIIGVFIPLLLMFSFLEIRDNPRKRRLWKRYFLTPLCLGFAAYLFINIQGLLNYASSQVTREHEPIAHIAAGIWEHGWPVLVAAVPAILFVLLRKKGMRSMVFMFVFASVIPAVHLATHRFATLDKHMYLTVVFLAPIIGYAASRLIIQPFLVRAAAVVCITGLLGSYAYAGVKNMGDLESRWQDSRAMQKVLTEHVKPGSRILTEEGAGTILALYDKIPPTQITTFDWFEYVGLTGDAAYIQAIRDGYFDIIELDGQSEVQQNLTAKVENQLSDKYELIYSKVPFEIYELTNE